MPFSFNVYMGIAADGEEYRSYLGPEPPALTGIYDKPDFTKYTETKPTGLFEDMTGGATEVWG